MKTIILALIFLARPSFATVAAPPVGFIAPADMFEARLVEYFPKEISDYISSYRMCQHFAGEEAYDEDRAKEIEVKSKKHCIDFKQVKESIRAKVKDLKKLEMMELTLKEIDAGESLDYSFVWNDPKKESKVLNNYMESEAQSFLKNVTQQMNEYELAEKSADPKKTDDLKYYLTVQFKYMRKVINEIERLHPETKKSVGNWQYNKKFITLAVNSEVENLTKYIQSTKTDLLKINNKETQKIYVDRLSEYRGSILRLIESHKDFLTPNNLTSAKTALLNP